MSGFAQAWNAYLCAMQGHVVHGVGTGTSPGSMYMVPRCSRCGAILRWNKS